LLKISSARCALADGNNLIYFAPAAGRRSDFLGLDHQSTNFSSEIDLNFGPAREKRSL